MAVGQKKIGAKNQNLIRAMASLGGGIASSGGPCGALTGGVAFLGSVLGKDEPSGRDDPRMWKACHEFYKIFKSEIAGQWESVNCSEIAGVNWKDRSRVREFYKGGGRIRCADNTGKAARLLGVLLEKYFELS